MKIRKFILLFLSFVLICPVWSCGLGGGGGNGTSDDDSDTNDNSGDNGASSTTPILATAVSVGGNQSFAVGLDGTVWAWGGNSYGENGTSTMSSAPAQVVGPDFNGLLANVMSVSAGPGCRFAITTDAKVWAWGFNGDNELGDGTPDDRFVPVNIASLTDIIGISSDADGGSALKSDGTVWRWGENTYGQIGDGTTTDRSSPVQVHGPNDDGFLTDIAAIATARNHTIALKEDGTVWSWGWNQSGQLGIGKPYTWGDLSSQSSATPVQVHGLNDEGFLTNVIAVDAKGGDWQLFTPCSSFTSHNIALKTDGTVWTWGANENGELGDGTIETRLVPVQVLDSDGEGYLTDVAFVAAGFAHSLAIKRDGTVWAWGCNINGQVGIDTGVENVLLPTRVVGIDSVVSVDGGYNHSIALKSDGTIWTWGGDEEGQLGNGPGEQSGPVPSQAVTTLVVSE